MNFIDRAVVLLAMLTTADMVLMYMIITTCNKTMVKVVYSVSLMLTCFVSIFWCVKAYPEYSLHNNIMLTLALIFQMVVLLTTVREFMKLLIEEENG